MRCIGLTEVNQKKLIVIRTLRNVEILFQLYEPKSYLIEMEYDLSKFSEQNKLLKQFFKGMMLKDFKLIHIIQVEIFKHFEVTL